MIDLPGPQERPLVPNQLQTFITGHQVGAPGLKELGHEPLVVLGGSLPHCGAAGQEPIESREPEGHEPAFKIGEPG